MHEGGLIMVLHSILIGFVLYIIMLYILKQPTHVAEDRSVFLGAIVLLYMVLFGHGLPKKVNSKLNFFKL